MRTPLYREAQRRVRQYVLTHGLEPGDPLPPEGQLAQDLGISRLSLREATKSLETLGVIQSVPGRGLFVSAFTFDAILEQLPYSFGISGGSLAEVLQVREAIEGGLIVSLAELITESELTELDDLVNQMQQAHDRGESFAEIDRKFHVRLFAPLDNGLVTGLLELFWDLFHKLESELPAGDQHSVEVHRDILAALRSGAAEQLRSSVVDHFAGIRESLRKRQEELR